MTCLPNPLDRGYAHGVPPTRILSDRGIRAALEQGLIQLWRLPPDKLEEAIRSPEAYNLLKRVGISGSEFLLDDKRLQPATLDVQFSEVDECALLPREWIDHPKNRIAWGFPHSFQPHSQSRIRLTERIEMPAARYGFLGPMVEARSSLRRLGCYSADSSFFTDQVSSYIEIGNFGPNAIHIPVEERFAQLFFAVHPFRDREYGSEAWLLAKKKGCRLGEQIRSLDMGVQVQTEEQLRLLERLGHLKVSPELKTYRGMVLVHASNVASRMKEIEGGIDFSKRGQYRKEDLLEPINIHQGYQVGLEHVVVETLEQFELSPHVGIWFMDNPWFGEESFDPSVEADYRHTAWQRQMPGDVKFTYLKEGWVDQGYTGGFSRQPKWASGREIRPGMVLGFGLVYFFPKPPLHAYGDAALGSQYRGATETVFAAKK